MPTTPPNLPQDERSAPPEGNPLSAAQIKPETRALLEMADTLDLTEKQRVFSETYAADPDHNGTKAAEAAGLGSPAVSASRMLKLAKVQQYIGALMATAQALAERRTAKKILSATDVLERLSEHADADMGDFLELNETGDAPRFAINREKTKLIKELTIKSGCDKDGMPWTESKIKLVDQQGALDKLGRHHGIFKDQQQGPASQTNIQINVRQQLEGMSTEEIKKLREAQRQSTEGDK